MMTHPEKPPEKIFSQESERYLVSLLIQLSPEQLASSKEELLICFKRAYAAHNKADRTVHRIWRRVVKNVKARP